MLASMFTLSDVIKAKAELRRKLLAHDPQASGLSMRHPDVPERFERRGRIVHSIGVGPKIVCGAVTDQLAVRVYVTEKLPTKFLPNRDTRVQGSIDGIPTDVIELPPPIVTPAAWRGGTSLEPWQGSVSPLRGGVGIAHEDGPVGTLAFIAVLSSGDKTPYLISNNHIIANTNVGKRGDRLYHPERQRGVPVGTLTTTMKLKFGTTKENFVDVAFGEVDQGVGHDAHTVYPAMIIGEAFSPSIGLNVKKHGFASGLTSGVIDDVSFDTMPIYTFEGKLRPALLVEQLKIVGKDRSFAEPGDSGAAVWCADTRRFVGLICAVGPENRYAVASPGPVVLESLARLTSDQN
jgi:hypothetical protein